MAARNFFALMDSIQTFPDEKCRMHALDSLKTNYYNGHPEMILIAMMGDDNLAVREKAVQILEGKKAETSSDRS